ncbi:MAG: hypothetical protein R3D98_17105 [Candidatus Krumholzibacteriia bacterium]
MRNLACVVLSLAASTAVAATLETAALVRIVPPVAASLAAPVTPAGETSWRIDAGADASWQIAVEARRLDGSLVDSRPAVLQDRSGAVQELATFAGPDDLRTAAQVVMTLVLCRE